MTLASLGYYERVQLGVFRVSELATLPLREGAVVVCRGGILEGGQSKD